MAWSWFGVKSIYQTTVLPAPGRGRRKQQQTSGERLVEERVILVRARSFDEAIAKAEKEAASYADMPRHRNHDGDLVETKYVGALNVFSIKGEPGSGQEVYSSMRVVAGDVHDDQLLDLLLGEDTSDDEVVEQRRKYEPAGPE